jgi:MFS family permease
MTATSALSLWPLMNNPGYDRPMPDPAETAPDRPATARTDGPEPGRAWTSEQINVLFATCIASFLPPFMSSSLNLAIPTIGAELGVSAVVVNWIVMSYLVASAAFLLPFGRLGDMTGRRRVFLAGMLIHVAFSLASGFAGSAASLIAFRLLQGVGGAMGFATGVAILTGAFSPEERGKVLGINTAAVYTGLSLGPVGGAFSRSTSGGARSSSPTPRWAWWRRR